MLHWLLVLMKKKEVLKETKVLSSSKHYFRFSFLYSAMPTQSGTKDVVLKFPKHI